VAVERLRCGAADAVAAAARLRALVPPGESVSQTVREVLISVKSGKDAAVMRHQARFGASNEPLRVSESDLDAALAALDQPVRSALEVTFENVSQVARAGLAGDRDVSLPQGHTVRLREIPVGRAGVYAPGGQAPYPSSVIMGVATARAAGVAEVAVCATHPVMLAAARLAGADEVFRMGGAQAIAALAYGTESVAPVDVIVGPGSLYAQEAKRQVAGVVAIDGFAGPSDLVVIASAGADPELVALDALAQAEHGAGTAVAVVSDDSGLLEAVAARAGDPGDAVLALVETEAPLAFAEAFAPEHLQLIGEAAESLAPAVTRAGCLFVGAGSATAFGDYVAGSNHVLPTEGAARFASGLNVRHFLRVMAEVRIPPEAAAQLAPGGAAIARAEGFEAHAASMDARMGRR
jgi:histidinol dehydrogenase